MNIPIIAENLKNQIWYPIYYNGNPIFAAKHALLGTLDIAAAKKIISVDTVRKLATNLASPHVFKTPFGTFEAETFDAWRRFHPTYEQAIRNIIKQRQAEHMQNGQDVVINAWANVGRWTIELANMWYNVLAFEPIPRVYDKLQKNIYLSNVTDRVHTFNTALGAEHKEEEMHVFRFHEWASYLDNVLDSYSLALAENIKVNVTPFDDVSSIRSEVKNRVGTIVLDVEWYELFVLQGMKKLLEKNRILDILVEISPKSAYKEKLMIFMKENNFVGNQIDSNNNRYFRRW